ncbi:MAG: glycosyltransferase family 2 protein [bacterium]
MKNKAGNRVICILPFYNELGKIGNTSKGFSAVDSIDEVIAVDDGSDDGSPEEARQAGVTVLRHTERRGVGAAIRTGIDHALEHGYDIIVVAAGNGKDRPDETDRLLTPILEEGYDYVQGSRYLAGGNPGKMPLHRIVCTRLYPLLIRIMLGFPATEGTNGFRAYKTSLVQDKRIDLWQDWLNGVELEYYLQVQAIRLGYRVKEAPVTKTYPSIKMRHYNHYTKASPWGIFNNLKPIFYLTLGIKR